MPSVSISPQCKVLCSTAFPCAEIIVRKFGAAEERELLHVWENVTFRIYGLAKKDARTGVGDYVRLAWEIMNDKATPAEIRSTLKGIAEQIISLPDAIEALRGADVYERREFVRYFMYRYEEYLAAKAGQKLNESQWNKIWADDPAKSIEHIQPQSSGVAYVHRLGNLTMLPPGTNSKLQDRDPFDKVSTYETSGLMATTNIARLLKKNTRWSAKTVTDRETELLRWAQGAWKD